MSTGLPFSTLAGSIRTIRRVLRNISADAASLTGSGAFDHIAFRAREPEVLIARLKDKGYPFRERQVPDMDLFQVFVEDPNGITVELNYWAADQKAA